MNSQQLTSYGLAAQVAAAEKVQQAQADTLAAVPEHGKELAEVGGA